MRAALCKTTGNNYRTMCSEISRVKRVYVKNSKPNVMVRYDYRRNKDLKV